MKATRMLLLVVAAVLTAACDGAKDIAGPDSNGAVGGVQQETVAPGRPLHGGGGYYGSGG